MDDETWNVIISLFGLLWSLSLLTGMYVFTLNHEMIHKEIYEQHGIPSSIHINLFGESYTEVEGERDIPSEVVVLNNLTEIIGYHSQAFLFNLWLMMGLLLIVLWYVVRKNAVRN